MTTRVTITNADTGHGKSVVVKVFDRATPRPEGECSCEPREVITIPEGESRECWVYSGRDLEVTESE